MRGKLALGSAGILFLVAGFVWFRSGEITGAREPRSPSRTVPANVGKVSFPSPSATPAEIGIDPSRDPARVTALSRNAEDLIVWPGSNEALRNLNAPDQSAGDDLQIVQTILADYRRVYGENPLGGLNEEITAGLRGDNPKEIQFLPESPARFNAEGELLDRWGAPYFFHKLSAAVMELRSAGPDHRMWTADDISDETGARPPL